MDQAKDNFYLTDNRKRFIPSIAAKAPVGILTFTSDWKIDYVNEIFIKYAGLYGFNAEKLEGFQVIGLNIFPGVDLKEDLLALKEGMPFEKTIKTVKTAEGGMLAVIAKAMPNFIENNFTGGILVLEDLKIAPEFLNTKDLKSEQIETVLNNTGDLLLITDTAGKIKYSFGKFLNKIGKNSLSLGDTKLDGIFPGNTSDEILKAVASAAAGKKPAKLILEFRVRQEDYIFECKIEPLLNWRSDILFVFIFFTEISDITKEMKSLETRVKELNQYKVITEAVTDAVFAVDEEGKIFFWNKTAESLFGYTRSEVYGKFFGRALDVFDSEYFAVIKEELLKTNLWKITLTVYKKNGQKEIIDAKFSYAGKGSGTIIVLCTNITERALKEEQLRSSEEKYKNIVNKTAELVCNIDIDGNITYANPSFFKALKYSENEITSKNFRDLISPEYLEHNDFKINGFDKIGASEIILNLITKKNEVISVKAVFSPVYVKNKLSYFDGIFTDITGTKRNTRDLKVFKSIFDGFQDGVAVECEGKFVMMNRIFPRLFGYSDEEELLGKDVFELIHPDDVNKMLGYIDLLSHKKDIPGRFEFMGKRKDGVNFYAETSFSSFNIDGKKYIVMVAGDITERKRAQQAIRDSEERYRNLTENIDDFLFNFESSGSYLRPVFYTASVEKITGYSRTELLSDPKLILKIIYPDDFSSLKKKLAGLMKSRIQLSGEFEIRIINRHGNVVWTRVKLNLIRNGEGRINKIYGLVSDISLRKKAENELNLSTDNLIKLNETKDRFISIISHDLRTPFSSILGFTDLLLSDKDLGESDRKQYIEFIQESSKSMLYLVNSLLDWTRLQTGRIKFEPERIEAGKIIENSLKALSGAAFQKNIEITSGVEDDVFVFADKDLVIQAFNNLISNAIKFTPRNGSIRISVAPSAKIRFLEFTVKDSGIGIKPENMDKLFRVDSKFTSEGTDGEKGTGLGLSLVKEIIEKHGGSIRAESKPGEGSEFIFTLPIGSQNILLVDDSKTDKLLYSKILKNITPDYNINIASDGLEALEKIKKSPPALIISDHTMPRMNGFELISELNKTDLSGKPPVIILSSNIDRSTIEDYQSLGVEFVFQKPVNLSAFKQAVEKTLRKGIPGTKNN